MRDFVPAKTRIAPMELIVSLKREPFIERLHDLFSYYWVRKFS